MSTNGWCPHCGCRFFWLVRRHHRKCRQCRREWSPRTVYPIVGFRLTRSHWHTVIDTFLRDETANAIEAEGHLSNKTARSCATFIRECLCADAPETLSGTTEADETYLGGAWKNKHVHIRVQGTKRGRGTSKQAIFGIVGREQEQARTWLVSNTKIATTRPHIIRTVARGSRVYTDGFKGYRTLPRYGYRHAWVDHDAGEYVRGDVHTQTLDGYWGLLKNFLAAKGGVQRRYLYRFVGEHQWRYNFRNLSRKEQVRRIYSLLTRFGGRM